MHSKSNISSYWFNRVPPVSDKMRADKKSQGATNSLLLEKTEHLSITDDIFWPTYFKPKIWFQSKMTLRANRVLANSIRIASKSFNSEAQTVLFCGKREVNLFYGTAKTFNTHRVYIRSVYCDSQTVEHSKRY